MARSGKNQSRIPSGPIAFFLSIILVVIGVIQLVSTFHTYAINLSELNTLRKTEAALIEKNQDLVNDIARWNDNEYVAAQARERLGFVFPGEQAIRVLHPEAVTGGTDTSTDTAKTDGSESDPLPWYQELSYAFEQADAEQTDPATLPEGTDGAAASNATSDGATPSSSASSTASPSASGQ